MKGIHKFFICYSVVITGFCIYLAVLSFGGLTKSQERESIKARETNTMTTTQGTKEKVFRLSVRDGHIVILQGEEIFETTSIAEEDMSDELKKEVEAGTYFDSEEEVYAFLESYTS
jgi:hydrogenase maturation factor